MCVCMCACVCVCVCVCLSGQDKLLRLLTPAGYSTNRLYMTTIMLGSRVESYDDKYLSRPKLGIPYMFCLPYYISYT